MLHVFFGNDTGAVRAKAFALVSTYEKRGAPIERIDTERYVEGIFTDAASGSPLFGGQIVYVVDVPSASKEIYEACIEALPLFQTSEHIFVVIEEKLLATQKKQFEKYAESSIEVTQAAPKRFNTFLFVEAFAKKDKKSLWMLLQEARRERIQIEEVLGILWWELKALRLAKQTTSAEEAGMKSFPYNNAKRALSQFTDDELQMRSHELLTIYHDAHRGVVDGDRALERWVLRL